MAPSIEAQLTKNVRAPPLGTGVAAAMGKPVLVD